MPDANSIMGESLCTGDDLVVARREYDLLDALPGKMTAAQWAALFVGLGIAARLVRFLLNFPLSGDEYQLAANFLDRGFLDLLRPLEHNQVAPIGFLWIEAAATRLFGYSEWSLRLLPVICGIGSVLLFRQVAGSLLRGAPFVLAVAIFSVAYYPIRLSAEVKPYACDAFVSLLLLWLTVGWWKNPSQSRWLWLLAALAPATLAISFPAAFVAGGLSLGIACTLWRRRQNPATQFAAIAWLAFNLAVAAAFLGLLQINIAAQYSSARHDMTECWANDFPPWREPVRFLGWLAVVHTSEMFAYPIGAEHGGSLATAICFAVALGAALRQPRREVAVTVIAWFGLSFVAALMHRYPYGGHARLSQYLAPAICLLGGAGAATIASRIQRQNWRRRFVQGLLTSCAVVAVAILVRDCTRPYKDATDRDHRDFARKFWNAAPDEQTLCLMTDRAIKAYDRSFATAYLCNQAIYSPGHRRANNEQPAATDPRPLRYVVFHSASSRRNDEVFDRWMQETLAEYDLAGTETHHVPLSTKRNELYDFYLMCYDVYHFRPRSVTTGDGNSRR